MTDVTSTYITNAGFETDEAADALNESQQNTPTGWTISPSSLGNTQWGTANSSTTIQGNSTTQTPSNGDKYLYFRDNWQNGTNISVSQDSKTEVPAGNYVIYIDVFTYSSNGTQPAYSFTVKDATNTYVNGTITANKKEWVTYYYHFKLENATTLTFSANMTPKAAASGKHDWLLLDNIKLLKADSPATPLTNGTSYYLYNESAGQFASAGGTWGTHAFADGTGLAMTAALSDGVYTLSPEEFSGKKFAGLYMDSGATTPWLFLETSAGSGKYYMTQDGVNFLASNGANKELVNVTSVNEAAVWSFISKADRKSGLSNATIDAPVNATFLLADPNFGRNNSAYSTWTWTFPNGENKNNAGDNTNFVVECFQKQFTFKQTLAAGTAPAGVYALTAQGFYRQDGLDNDHLPVFFANDETQTFPIRGAAAENSMNTASTSFLQGNYTIEPIYVRVESTDALEIGAKLETNEKLWCIWDNFQLKYFGDVTVAAVKMKASVDAYTAAKSEADAFTEASMFAEDWSALQSAITANTVDLNDPSLEESTLTTATANLVAANTAASAAVASKTTYDAAVTAIGGQNTADVTSIIANPSFESDFTGWTNTGSMAIQTNTSFSKTGSKYAEFWQPNGTKGVSQVISVMPAGVYVLTADVKARGVTSAKIFAGSTETSMNIGDFQNTYSATVEIADKGAFAIGFEGVGTGAGSSWFALDNFTLTYYKSIANLPYTLATGKMGTDKAAAQTAAETTFIDDPTIANYNALLAAIAEAEVSVANYAALKTAIDKAEAVKVANNFVTADATTAFTSEITTATNAWTNVTYTDVQCNTEITTLGATASGWHAIANEGKAGAYMASAWGKTSENWWEAPYINTWSTEGDNDGSGFSVPFFEYYAENNQNLPAKTMTATLTGLENGMYEVELWARVQRRSDADFNADNSMITMSVNGGKAQSIMSNTENNVGSGTSVMRLGRYTARGEVTDGTLTLSIDVKLGANVHWLSWRDVKYTKLTAANMSIMAGKYGTFVAPFDVTIPSGVTAQKVTGVSGQTLTLVDVTTTIPENTPVVVYSDAAVNETFYGKDNSGGEETKTVGLLTGLLTNGSVPAGSYVLQTISGKQAFYQLENGITGVANRAYLTISSPIKAFFFDNETAINGVEAEVNANEAIFNLAGQRVSKAQKGIYVKNGRKVVIK